VGNIVYYLFLASSIQRAGAPLPTMIIGTLRWSSPSAPTCATTGATASCPGCGCCLRWR